MEDRGSDLARKWVLATYGTVKKGPQLRASGSACTDWWYSINTETMQGSCQTRVPDSSAHVHWGLGTVAGSLLQLGLEDVGNDLRSSLHPVGRVHVPAPLNHVPYAICHFRINRLRWSIVADSAANEHLQTGKQRKVKLTSQASIPSANVSVALAVRAWTSPKERAKKQSRAKTTKMSDIVVTAFP